MQKNKTKSCKVALITGAARRIGAEIARILHENGFNVALHYNTSQQAAKNYVKTLMRYVQVLP